VRRSTSMSETAQRIVAVVTVLLLGLFGVVWVGANPVGGGILLALATFRLVALVRKLRSDAHTERLRHRLAQIDRELEEPGGPGDTHRDSQPP